MYVSISTPLLEGAIFPWLYWRRELCESHGRDGNLVTDREHAKFEYACKALGEVVGYRANW